MIPALGLIPTTKWLLPLLMSLVNSVIPALPKSAVYDPIPEAHDESFDNMTVLLVISLITLVDVAVVLVASMATKSQFLGTELLKIS